MAILSALLLILLVGASASSEEADPEYPLGKLRFPSLTEPADPIMLTDLRYRLIETRSTAQQFEVRLRWESFAFFGGEVFGQRRGLFFQTQRFDVNLTEENGRYDLEASFRGPRLLFRADVLRRPNDRGWVLNGTGAVRLSSDFELLFEVLDDTNKARALAPRAVRRGSVGFLYQRDTHFDLAANVSRRRLSNLAGIPTDLDRASSTLVLYRGPFQLQSDLAYDRFRGRLGRDEGFVALGVDTKLGPRFLLRGRTAQRWEPGIKRFDANTRIGLTFFGREFRFARASRAADRTLELARRAYELGYNERRVYRTDQIRAFRERLALSDRRHELAPAIDRLYREQVRARNVPQAGFELRFRSNDLRGVRATTYHLFVGIPWRIRWPFERRESSVEFIQLEYTQTEEEFAAGPKATTRELVVELALNREMSFRFFWQEPGRTPTDIAFQRFPSRRIELEYAYAFGL